jgi:two-component system chemotaxis response regulator CheY
MGLYVLAVDDSRTIREMLRLTLDGAGHTTLVAEDGEDGLAVLCEHISTHGAPDAVITDINMPRLNGIEFIKGVRARAETRLTPILVLSTESEDHLKTQARDAGATGWIVKPFDPDKLLRAVDMVAG